jgi:creatinine amidohydrolase/Fe(II)-dependent formamide hydrolase-like protein
MVSRPAEEMRPCEVIAAREESGCAFVPVGPMFEWHSFHLPVGTDALVAEAVCRIAAERVGGIYFRPLSFGLDAWRSADELRAWGFHDDERVYGMRFPELPVVSEYAEPPEMQAAVRNRLFALRGTGFRHVFLVNHHGGRGQFAALEALAAEHSADGFAVHAVRTYQLSDLDEESLRVGGHAGLSETTWVMAFRPELVDLTQHADGELSVRHTGILHGKPTIEPQWNPRRASMAVACALRERVLESFLRFVVEEAGLT